MKTLASAAIAVAMLVGVAAQAAPAIHCNLDTNLRGRELDTQLSMNLTLERVDAESTPTVSVYTVVRGSGSYVSGADTGKLKVEGGRYSDQSSDTNRFIDVRLTTGARKDVIYRIHIVQLVSGTPTSTCTGSWEIPGTESGDLQGTTDC